MGSWLNSLHHRYPPLEPFEHYEHGKDADTSFKDLLKNATVTDLTAAIGAEVHGVQLSQLGKEGKDQLARFVAEKKVVGKWTKSSSAVRSGLI